MKLPDGWRDVLNRARDNICPGGTAEAAAYERQIVGPYIDWIFDELEDLEAGLAEIASMPPPQNMIHADIYGTAERRYRPCQNCHEDFKYVSEDNWLCPVCIGLRKEMERRQVVEGWLLDANKVFK
jgi:hypothetical protein